MNNFYSDKPVDSCNEDLLDRSSFSKLLATTLASFENSETFTIGLFGRWGTGKTSIVNMTLNEIESSKAAGENQMTVVRFEPWNFSDPTELLSQFFLRLSNEFKGKTNKKLKSIGKAIEDYSCAFELANFIPLNGAIIASIGKSVFSTIGRKLQGKTDVLTQKQKVIDLLKKQKHQILVVIDDIDRLSNEQIRQVFQLVSSVAKFPNTIYLLVFDKKVVLRALEKVQEGDGEEYLEKVIQMPIQIPDIPETNLNAVLLNKLNEVLRSFPTLALQKEREETMFYHCLYPFISNLRDINRLCNTLNFKMTTISSEIDFVDMVIISTIEVCIPPIYEWIKRNRYLLTSASYGEKPQKEQYDFCLKTIGELLQSYYSEEKYTPESVITLLSYLFPYFGQKIGQTYVPINPDSFRRNNYISHPEKFERYFYYDINRVELKRFEIENAVFNFDNEELTNFLIKETNNNRGTTVIKEMMAAIDDITSDRAKMLFETLISIIPKVKDVEKNTSALTNSITYIEFLCLDLLKKIDAEERNNYLNEIIVRSELESLGFLSTLLNMIELAYGRLAAEGTERNFKKVITLEELLQTEIVFTNRVKDCLDKNVLFDCDNWRMLLYLLKSFDPVYVSLYVPTLLKENLNIIIYISNSVNVWIGAGNSYEVVDNYSEYLNSEQIIRAIKCEVNSKNIFKLDKKVVEKCAAFYLNACGRVSSNIHISQDEVDKEIASWKENTFAKV